MLNRLRTLPLTFAHISLTIVGLMWVLPFLYYHHAYPITTFYQEITAAALALAALPLLLSGRYWQAPEIPRITLLPIGLMMLMLVQYLTGMIEYFDHVLLLMLYFLLATLLIMLGHRLREELGLPQVVSVLAVFLLLGAELNALAGVLQHYRWHTFLDGVITVKVSAAVYGNIAQPNHYADYLALGLASLGLLLARGTLKHWQAGLLALPLLFVMVLSGSRSSWLYLAAMLLLAWWWQRRQDAARPLMYFSGGLLLGFALMHGAVQLPWLAGASDSVSTVERMFGEASAGSGGIRLYLWQEAAMIFAQHPWLGAGFGQYSWQHFMMGPVLADPVITGLYNNAHNIVMHLAAETGVAGLAILLVTVGMWLWGLRGTQYSIYHWWGYAVLAVLAIHSLLEYPLWYLYFIGIAAVMLGMMDGQTHRLELRRLGRLSVAMMLVLGVLSLGQLYQGYKKLEVALTMRPAAPDETGYGSRLRDAFLAVYEHNLMRSYSELFLTGLIEPTADHIADKLRMNERAMHFAPISSVVYRQAWLLALADQPEQAKLQLHRAIWAYPQDFPRARAELSELARNDPGHFAALLEFATQKFEEYQRGVSKQ